MASYLLWSIIDVSLPASANSREIGIIIADINNEPVH